MVKIIRGSCQGREGGPGDRRGIYERERESKKFWQKICIQIFVFTGSGQGELKSFS